MSIEVPWNARGVAVGVAIVAAASGLGIALLSIAYRTTATPTAAVLLTTFVLEAAMVGAAVALGPARKAPVATIFGPTRLRTLPLAGWGAVALLGSVALGVAYIAVAALISDNLTPSPLPIDVASGDLRWLAFAIIVIAGPIAEEVFYRGFVFAGLIERLGTSKAAVVSSAAFAAAHLDIAVAGPAFFSGLVFALVYRRTGSLWPAILAHVAQNAIAFAFAG